MDVTSTSDQLESPLLPTMEDSSASADATAAEFHDENSNVSPLHTSPMEGDSTVLLTGDNTPDDENEDVWYRNPHQVTAMISNYSTSYNVVNISLVLPILEQLTTSSSEEEAACASSLLAGMILGQLIGGVLGDSFLGRLGALRVVMGLQIVASLVSALLPLTHIYMHLAVCRFLLGVGAGGVYPLAAVLSAEQGKKTAIISSSHDSIHRVVLTFSTQGLGFVTVPIVTVGLLYMTTNLNLVWRVLLGLGSLPGFILLILQWRFYTESQRRGQAVPLEESEAGDVRAPSAHAAENNDDPLVVSHGEEDHDGILRVDAPSGDEPYRQSGWWESIKHEPDLGRKILGTAGTWCLFDVLFYGNTLFQPIVVEAAFGAAKSESPIHLLQKTALNSLVLTSIALPGYAVAGWIMGKQTGCVVQTPRYVMLQGFAAMSVLYMIIGLNWSYLRHYPAVLVSLYGMTFFFANYGPNTTTFILPSLLYSPECRSTLNGISAASGKFGALVGATLFAPTADAWGDACVMLICAGVAVVAFVLTYCFVPNVDERERQTEGATNTNEAL